MGAYFNRNVSCSGSSGRGKNIGIRRDRVLDIRGKLKSGKYNIAEHLDVVVDKLLEDVLAQDPENKRQGLTTSKEVDSQSLLHPSSLVTCGL